MADYFQAVRDFEQLKPVTGQTCRDINYDCLNVEVHTCLAILIEEMQGQIVELQQNAVAGGGGAGAPEIKQEASGEFSDPGDSVPLYNLSLIHI